MTVVWKLSKSVLQEKKKKKKIIIQKPHRLFIEDVNPQVKTNYYKTPN